MKEINRERFEAWLFSQPKEREFDYMNVHGKCAICSFVRETSNIQAWGGSDELGVLTVPMDLRTSIPIPDWARVTRRGVLSVRPLTIANMQNRYLELFPDALKLPEVKTETVKHEQNS